MSRKIPQRPAVDDSTRVIERPDGFYWIDDETRAESGPFVTLEEAESEIGIANWIDPDTGEPAEESVPRIEDH